MLLLADSGATKTDWRLVDNEGKISTYATQGISPYFFSTTEIAVIVKDELLVNFKDTQTVTSIHFYGTGCSTEKNCNTVKVALQQHFTKANIEINHDLLAAARAICGHKSGIAAILGTGSNSCSYNGKQITANMPSMGYLLGDEGSGANIGLQILKDFLNKEMPNDLAHLFFETYKMDNYIAQENVYQKPMPSRFLAKFARFAHTHLKDPYCQNVVEQSFTSFFNRHICKYPNYETLPFGSVGSIGFYFADTLKKVAQQKNVEVKTILESPMEGLLAFHLEK